MAASSLNLPDNRSIALAAAVSDRLLAGVVSLTSVAVREEPEVWRQTSALAAELAALHAGKLPSEIAELQEVRILYKSFGMDPSRHRPSSEALLRRILKGQDLYRINNAVDCCNLASLRYLLPIGMYDQHQIVGDIVLRLGLAQEQYVGIRKGPVHLGGRLGLFDRLGGFGSPTSDSARTSVTTTTTEILAVLMATNAYEPARMQAHLEDFADLFVRFCGARCVVAQVLKAGA